MPTVASKTFPFARKFQEWRTLKGQAAQITERQTQIRDQLRDEVKEMGEEVDGGHFIWTFKNPVTFAEGRKVHLYTGLKAERRLVPAAPTPDPELAEDLLREKGLWMSEEAEKHLESLRISCPNVSIIVEPDIDAVSVLYLKGIISEHDYETILVEQKEQWAFVPQEEK